MTRISIEVIPSTRTSRLTLSLQGTIVARTRDYLANYMNGTGHAFLERCEGLIDITQEDTTGDVELKRALRFLKSVTGAEVIPIIGRKIFVCLPFSFSVCVR